MHLGGRIISLFAMPLLAAVMLLALSTAAQAQSTATLQGTVTDPQGAVVPNATVVVRNESTSLERTTQTDSAGNYQFAALPVGKYRVDVRAQGFKGTAVTGLTVEVARTEVQDFHLEIGDISQEVVVSSDAPVIETATTSVGTVINQRTVQEIPLNGRHMLELGLLIPGSVTTPANGFLTTPIRGQGALSFNTAGAREDTVNLQINGVNLNDMVQNQATFQPSINTVQEFRVDNSTFSAEYGRNSGAIVNVATRSGANAFHGEAFEFFRNDALDARNFFDGLKAPPFKRNQYGGNIGGPIYLPHFGEGGPILGYKGKNRTFFFFSFEGIRQRQGLTVNSGVLSDAQRAAATDPASIKLITLIPRANFTDASGNPRFVGSATAPVNLSQWTLDISHNFSSNDRLHGYYAKQSDLRKETLSATTIPDFGDTRQGRRQILTLNETHTFGPNLVNEARLGFNRVHITFFPNAELNPADFGINGGITDSRGLPNIRISGISLTFGGPNGFPQGRADTTYVVSDTLSYLRGKHSLKIGGEFRRFFNNNFNGDTGIFTFAGPTDFINGKVNQFIFTKGDVTSAIAVNNLGLYIQDNYKWRRNVTLELGFRYDLNATPTERFNRFVVFDPLTASLLRVGSGLDQVYHTNNKNFQPRVGFSWDPFKDGKTTVRGAYAILTDQPVTNLVTGLTTNPPLANPINATGSGITFANAISMANPSGTVSPATVQRDFDNAYVQSWNLNVQREVGPGLGVMIGYFGSKGTHLRITRNINQPINGVRPFAKLSSASPILPGAALTNINETDSAGNSSYNGLWASVNKRLSRGLQFNVSYTWSKSIDYNSRNGGVFVQDSYNLRGDRGLSDFDARHRLAVNWLYELPFRGNQLVEGWQLAGITQLQSGNPIQILASPEFVGFTGNSTLRPDAVGSVPILGSANQWFPNAVCDPRPGKVCPSGTLFIQPVSPSGVVHFGSLGRNVLIGPRFINTDFSIVKNTKLSESMRVQFRAEFFDIFNHPNFGQPGGQAGAPSRLQCVLNCTSTSVGSPNFGTSGQLLDTRFPTGDSGSSRQVQFALKFLF